MSRTHSMKEAAYQTYLDMHVQMYAKLKMLGKLTAQHEEDCADFLHKLAYAYATHGFDFYLKIVDLVPGNTWLPLFREYANIIDLEEVNIPHEKCN